MTDLATGLYAQGAIMAALLQRRSCPDGLGQKIDCDLLSTQVSQLFLPYFTENKPFFAGCHLGESGFELFEWRWSRC